MSQKFFGQILAAKWLKVDFCRSFQNNAGTRSEQNDSGKEAKWLPKKSVLNPIQKI